jgi:thiamine-phosphate pyrophosphorylase
MPPACRLYLITPPAIDDLSGFARTLEDALAAGDVAALQVRLKGASDAAIEAAVSALRPIARARQVALILNDRPDLAARLGCDGVHIGQGDGPFTDARRLMGADRLVGVTCHDSRHLGMDAAEAGADYVAFGAFFPTRTKETTERPDPEILSIWQESMLIPCVAIGGITAENCRALVAAGADFLAVSSAVWTHPQGPAAAVAAFNAEIDAGLVERRHLAERALP